MAKFRVYAERTVFIEAEIEAADTEDARQIALDGFDVDWEPSYHASEDDVKLIEVEQIEDEDEDDVPPL